METKKQTAVEWLVTKINQKIDYIPMSKWNEIRDVIQEALAIEKEQIETAYERGLNFPWALGCEVKNYQEEARQFYKINYGKSETINDGGGVE